MQPKTTTEQFIKTATEKFGDKYDYTLTEFKGSHHPVTVICKEHGEFSKPARDFLKRGCSHCGGRKPMTTERFLAMSREIYGDTYDYSESVATSLKSRVIIKCKVPGHGSWTPTVENHINGVSGCPLCAGNVKYTTETFIAKAQDVHQHRYSYEYVKYAGDNKVKVVITCPKHGNFEQSPMAHLAGQGCPTCANKGTINTASVIERSKSVHGDKFDYSETQINKTTDKLKLTCKECGYVFEQRYSTHIFQRSGCPRCAGRILQSTEEFIVKAKDVHGDTYDYSQTKYAGTAKHVTIVCKKHGAFEQFAGHHLNGGVCPSCFRESLTMTTEQYVARARAKHGDKFDYGMIKYTSHKDKITVICKEHGVFEVLPIGFLKTENGCMKCAGNAQLTVEQFVEKARKIHGETYDYSKVEYKNHYEHVTITCKTHGDFNQSPGSHAQGRGCPKCANYGPSKAQIEIYEFLSKHTEAILEHKFEGISYVYDIYLPEHKLAIEFNGLFWHSTRRIKDEDRDYAKYKAAMDIGVRTFTIFEDEWQFQPDTIKQSLLSAIGALPRVFARKCTIDRVEPYEYHTFFQDNHIQGSPRNPEVVIGLYYNHELVACMAFGQWRSNRRNVDKRHWELTRYACHNTVVGGASKLFAFFAKMKLADKVTSYSDVRMFNGNMYEKLGFTKVHQTRPDYQYVNPSEIKWRSHKSNFQKKHLVRKFPGCDIENKTEKQICEENGYYQIYDCGKIRWDIDLTEKTQTAQ